LISVFTASNGFFHALTLSADLSPNPLIWSVSAPSCAQTLRLLSFSKPSSQDRLIGPKRWFLQSLDFTRRRTRLPEIKNAQVHEENAEKPDLHRLAKLSSVGPIPIPGDLTQAEQQQLLYLIAKSR